jgi:glycosyltransferase involved in cell wall biosynthesis
MTAPLVSVVIAARDAARTLPAAIGSILAQDGPDLEVIVVDDGSIDATSAAARSVQDARVTVLRCEQSTGRARARNLAAGLARGTYIAVQDADDVSLPGRLSATVELAERDTDTVVVSGQAVFEAPRLGAWRLRRYPLHDAAIRAELQRGSMALLHGGCLIRRSAFDAVGGYDVRCVRAQDLNLMLRLSALGRFAAVEQDVLRYRHPVILPPAYWWESRRFAKIAIDRAAGGGSGEIQPSALAGREAWRYVPAMARRLVRYAAS